MEWGTLGWSALQKKLKEPARALVVDDEEIVRGLLVDILQTANFTCVPVTNAEEALEQVRVGHFDVLITDKNLPGHDGVDLIAQVRAEGFDVPSVLVTGYPSAATISRALANGAADYIAKPFDDVRVVRKRIEAVVERRRAERFLRRVLTALREASSRHGLQEMGKLEEAMREFRAALAPHPDVLLVEPNASLRKITEQVLRGGGLSVRSVGDVAEACEAIEATQPMCCFVALTMPGACQLVEAAKNTDGALELIVSGGPASIDEAVTAVGKGASDFVLGASEGLELLIARVKRAVVRGRQHRVFRHFVQWLLACAQENPAIAPVLEQLLGSPAELGASPAPARAEKPTTGRYGALPTALGEGLEPSAPIACGGVELESGAQRPAAQPAEDMAAALSAVPFDQVVLGEDPAEPARPPSGVGPMSAPLADGARLTERHFTSMEEQVAFGLENVEAERTAPIPVRSLLYACAALEETIRFLHEPQHYPDLASLKQFVGGADQGALAVLLRAHYEHLRPFLPQDVLRALDAGEFDHPNPPSYLKRVLGN